MIFGAASVGGSRPSNQPLARAMDALSGEVSTATRRSLRIQSKRIQARVFSAFQSREDKPMVVGHAVTLRFSV